MKFHWPWMRKEPKEPAEPVISEVKCPHTYKDFPWYMESQYDRGTCVLHFKIIEPYVCLHCGDRQNIILEKGDRYVTTYKEACSVTDFIYDQHKDDLRQKAVVEDMIHDAIYVDREKLDILERLRNAKNYAPGIKNEEETKNVEEKQVESERHD